MKRYKGQIRITTQMVEELIGLPEDIKLYSIVHDPIRDIYSFVITSGEAIENWTVETEEGHEPMNISGDTLHPVSVTLYKVLDALEAEGRDLNEFLNTVLELEGEEDNA